MMSSEDMRFNIDYAAVTVPKVLVPSVLVPEGDLRFWGAVFVPSIITLLNASTTPKSLHLLVFWRT